MPGAVNLDSLGQSNNLSIFVQAAVSLLEGSSPIKSVNCNLSDAAGSEVLANGRLLDDGLSLDRIVGDSVFTGQLLVSGASLSVGTYYCKVQAQSTEGLFSNTYLLPINIYRLINHPPSISDAQAPDTI